MSRQRLAAVDYYGGDDATHESDDSPEQCELESLPRHGLIDLNRGSDHLELCRARGWSTGLFVL
jgi:hypothetical protein